MCNSETGLKKKKNKVKHCRDSFHICVTHLQNSSDGLKIMSVQTVVHVVNGSQTYLEEKTKNKVITLCCNSRSADFQF